MIRDDLLAYYERELTFVRQMGAEFAEKYPKVAGRLLLEPDRCEDPHVERLIESFAFLAARVHMKLDDDFPEITEALLSILYPHYVRPIPSMSVVEFQLDPEQGKLSTGLPIPRGSVLESGAVEGERCKFRTCYETTLWPLSVAEANWLTPDRLKPAVRAPEAIAALRVVIGCMPDVSLDQLQIKHLRFYLNGESVLVHTLYELLCNNTVRIIARDPSPKPVRGPLELDRSDLRPVGFAEEEALLPYPKRSFVGYRLLQEYFSFPEKFFFLDLCGMDRVAAAGFKDKVEIVILVSPFERNDRQQMLELNVSPKTLRTGCVPAINLFPKTAEGIILDQTRYEYPVIPDVRRRQYTEIFSVDSVYCINPENQLSIEFEPFYAYRHRSMREKKAQTFWHSSRRPSVGGGDELGEVFVTLVDMTGRPRHPDSDVMHVKCTCTNKDLPSRLPFGNERGDFQIEGLSAVRTVVALRKPTPSIRPPMQKGALWRLISHLSLNYLSLVEEGKDALQEILRLYNFSESVYLEKQIAGIVRLASRRHFARVDAEGGIHFVRGTRVDIEFDEEQFVGGGVYLFASVLEHFLGLYTSMNSFSQLIASTTQRKEKLAAWPPRAGQSILL
jgi:type VI secretion system protein ImpG